MPRTVLITGCSAGGIGSALAIAFANRGCKVYATARNPSKMVHLQSNPLISTLELDPTSVESVDACLKQVEADLSSDETLADGKLDVLINNAGQAVNSPILDADIEASKAMYDINIWGCVRVTQKFSKLVINAKGTIVFNSSIGSSMDLPFLALYGASKSALNQISNTLRLELAPFGVKVVTLMTGAVKSEISKKESVREWRLSDQSLYKPIESEIIKKYTGTGMPCMDADQYAKSVANTVLGGANGLVWKGTFAPLAWFLTTFMPRWILDIITVSDSGLKNLRK